MDLFSWSGAAGICVNERQEVLLVLQGAPGEERKWTVPSGSLEGDESFESCCIREFKEETGYDIRIVRKLDRKLGALAHFGITFNIQYFQVEIIGGECELKDPDGLIHAIDWHPIVSLDHLPLAYPEDIERIQNCIK